MPASVKKVGSKYRVVEPSGKALKNKAGSSADGGGHKNKSAATKQAQAINLSMLRAKGRSVPAKKESSAYEQQLNRLRIAATRQYG